MKITVNIPDLKDNATYADVFPLIEKSQRFDLDAEVVVGDTNTIENAEGLIVGDWTVEETDIDDVSVKSKTFEIHDTYIDITTVAHDGRIAVSRAYTPGGWATVLLDDADWDELAN